MSIVAIWMVQGETLPELKAMADSDALIFGCDERYSVHLWKCAPQKIDNGRVTKWRGWAVVTHGTWDNQDILSTCFHEESSLAQGLSRSLARLDSSSSTTST